MRCLALSILVSLGIQDSKPWRIVYERDYKLWSIRQDGSDSRAEAEKTTWHALSPDGKHRVYVSDDGGQGIWVADADGRNAKRLSEKGAIDGDPSWTPDGKRIVFNSHRDGRHQVWIMEADGSKPVQLTHDKGHIHSPRISPCGDRIAYVEGHSFDGKTTQATLRTMDLAGGDSKTLIDRAPLWDYAWDPTGDRMACGMSDEVRIIRVSDGRTLQSFALAEIHKDLRSHAPGFFQWRPDGESIACTIRFVGNRKDGERDFGDDKIFVLPLKGKPAILEAGGRAIPRRWTR